MNVGTLTAFLKLDRSQYSSGIQQAQKEAQQMSGSLGTLESSVSGTTAAFSNMGRVAKTVAAAFAALQVVQYAKEATVMAMRYETLGVVLTQVGKNAGYTSAQMFQYEKELRKTGIAAIEARAVLTRLTQAQIDLTQTSKLARVAQDAAVIGNINSSEAFERMVHGIQSGQTEILRGLGLQVSMEQAYKKFADQLGKNKDALTETERMQARVNAVMEAGSKIAGTYEASMGTAGKQIRSMRRYLDDIKVAAGQVFLGAAAVGASAFTGQLKDIQKELEGNEERTKRWADSITRVTEEGIRFVGVLRDMVAVGLVIGSAGGLLFAFTNLSVLILAVKSALVLATAAVGIFTAACMANPILAGAILLTGAVTAMMQYVKQTDAATDAAKKHNAAVERWNQLSGEMRAQYKDFAEFEKEAGKFYDTMNQPLKSEGFFSKVIAFVTKWSGGDAFAKFMHGVIESDIAAGRNLALRGLLPDRPDPKVSSMLSSSRAGIPSDALRTSHKGTANVVKIVEAGETQRVALQSRLNELLKDAITPQEKYAERMKEIASLSVATNMTLAQRNKLEAEAAKLLGSPAAKEAEKYKNAQQELIDTLLPLQKLEKDHAENLGMLENWYSKNKSKVIEYTSAKALLVSQFEDQKKALQGESVQWIEAEKAAKAYQEVLVELHANEAEAWQKMQTAINGIEFAGLSDTERAVFTLNQQFEQLEAQIEQLRILGVVSDAKAESLLAAIFKRTVKDMEELSKKGKTTFDLLTQFQIQAYRSMQDAAADFFFDPFKDGLSGMLDSFLKMTQRMVAEWMAAQAMMGLFGKDFGTGGALGGVLGSAAGAISGAWNTPGNFLGDLHVASYGGGRASGGPVGPGKFYEVNERGPELLEMGNRQFLMMGNSSGNVVPGGSSSVQVNVINNANGTRATAQERSGSDGGRIIDVFVEQVKGAIASDISRGSGVIPAAMGSTYGLNRVPGAY